MAQSYFLEQARELGVDPEKVRNTNKMTDVEASEKKVQQEIDHKQFVEKSELLKKLKKGSSQAKAIKARLEELAEKITFNEIDIKMRAPEFWDEAGASYFESGSAKARIPAGKAVSINAREALGDLRNQYIEIVRKIADKEKKLSNGGKMAVNDDFVLSAVAADPGFSKYAARVFMLSDEFLVKLGSLRKFMLKRRANKIYEFKNDPVELKNIFDKMDTQKRAEYVRSIMKLHGEILKIMEKEIVPQRTKIMPYGLGARKLDDHKKEEDESDD